MNKRNIITILCLAFSFISALAQSQSFFTENHVVKVGDTYYAAKEVSMKDNQIVITGDNGETTYIAVEHGKNMPVEVSADKGILCSVAGTLTKDLVNKAIASGHLNICGSINDTDLFNGCLVYENENANVPVEFMHVSGMTYLNRNCFNFPFATSIIFKDCDFSSVTTLSGTFSKYNNIESFSFNGMGLRNVISLKKTFEECKSITTIDFTNFDTSKVTTAENLFSDCFNLKVIDFSGCDLSKLTKTTNMFSNCSNLEEVKAIGCNQKTIDILEQALLDNQINIEITK